MQTPHAARVHVAPRASAAQMGIGLLERHACTPPPRRVGRRSRRGRGPPSSGRRAAAPMRRRVRRRGATGRAGSRRSAALRSTSCAPHRRGARQGERARRRDRAGRSRRADLDRRRRRRGSSDGAPVTADTVFRAASITKMVVGARRDAARRAGQARPRPAARELPGVAIDNPWRDVAPVTLARGPRAHRGLRRHALQRVFTDGRRDVAGGRARDQPALARRALAAGHAQWRTPTSATRSPRARSRWRPASRSTRICSDEVLRPLGMTRRDVPAHARASRRGSRPATSSAGAPAVPADRASRARARCSSRRPISRSWCSSGCARDGAHRLAGGAGAHRAQRHAAVSRAPTSTTGSATTAMSASRCARVVTTAGCRLSVRACATSPSSASAT